MAAAQEQDRQDRLEFQAWSKNLSAQVARLLEHESQLLDYQSRRMDRLDKFYMDWLKQNHEFQQKVLNLLTIILDRLPPLPQSVS